MTTDKYAVNGELEEIIEKMEEVRDTVEEVLDDLTEIEQAQRLYRDANTYNHASYLEGNGDE